MVVTQHIRLSWKNKKVDLSTMENDLRIMFPNYVGNTAGPDLCLFFIELNDEIKSKIYKYWDEEVPLTYCQISLDKEFEELILKD